MSYSNIFVVGGSGFVGRHVVAALSARGLRVTVPSRRRERAKHLLLLPTVEVIEADVNRPGVLARLLRDHDAVINLAGVLHSRRGRLDERGPNNYGPDFARAHVELPQAILAACRETGVRRMLHMSALGAGLGTPSEYLRSKGMGEKAVLAADDVGVTVFRPSVVFGPEDRFLNLFAMLTRLVPIVVLGSPGARFQPVYVGDVVEAFIAALDSRAAIGERYDLCGPKVYTLRRLVELVCEMTGRRRPIVGLSERLSYLQAWLLEFTPGPLMTRDNHLSMQVPNVCECAPPFGIEPQALEAVARAYLAPEGPRERYPRLRWRARR